MSILSYLYVQLFVISVLGATGYLNLRRNTLTKPLAFMFGGYYFGNIPGSEGEFYLCNSRYNHCIFATCRYCKVKKSKSISNLTLLKKYLYVF